MTYIVTVILCCISIGSVVGSLAFGFPPDWFVIGYFGIAYFAAIFAGCTFIHEQCKGGQ